MSADRDLLFGVLAVQLGFASPRQVMSSGGAWASDRSKGIAERLQADGIISSEKCRILEGLVESAIQLHGGDAKKTIDSFGGQNAILKSFGGSVVYAAGGTVELKGMAEAKTEEPDEDPISVTTEQPDRYHFGESEPTEEDKDSAEIGRGGIGRVLVAYDQHLNREIALKELLPEKFKQDDPLREDSPAYKVSLEVARFLREARVTGQLEHPNIVPVYELGQRKDGTFYYTMKLVRGRTLASALEDCKGLADRLRLLGHFTDLCQAIAYAHSRGVVHRDIKAENIMLGEFGETVVLDWGLAKVRGKEDTRGKELLQGIKTINDIDSGKTADGTVVGTPLYMSPEQANGEIEQIDERSDVWALGVLLYFILTGRFPFEGETLYAIVADILTKTPKPVRDVWADAPPELAAVAEKALSRDKDQRYQTAGQLAEETEAYMTGGRVRAYEYSGWELLGRFARKYKSALVVAAVGTILMIALGIVSYLQVIDERNLAQEAEAVARRSEKKASAERDKARKNLSGMLVARAKAAASRTEAILYAAEALKEAENPEARGLVAGLVDMPHPRLKWESRPGAACVDLHFSPDGKFLACSALVGGYVWDLSTGEESFEYQLEASSSRKFSPDGQYLAEGLTLGHLRIFSIASGEEVVQLGGKVGVNDISFSPDGSRIASVSRDGSLAVWDWEKKEQVFSFRQSANLNGVDYSPDGATIAAACSDGSVLLFKEPTEKEPIELKHHVGEVRDVRFSPDGNLLASLGQSGLLLVWDLRSMRQHQRIEGKLENANRLDFSRDGRLLASASEEGVHIWEVSTGELKTKLDNHLGGVLSVAFAPAGDMVATSGIDHTVQLWDLNTGRSISSVNGHGDVRRLAIALDGSFLVSAGWDGIVWVWDTETGRMLRHFGHPGENAASSMAISPDGKTLAVGEGSGFIRLWDATTWIETRSVRADNSRVTSLAFTADSRNLLSASMDGSIRQWNVSTGQHTVLHEKGNSKLRALAITRGGKRIAYGLGNTVSVANLPDLDSPIHLKGHDSDISALAFTPDGSGLASGDGAGFVKLWKLNDGEVLVDRHVKGGFNCLSFSPDGKLLAAGSQDRTVRIWEMPTGRELAKLHHVGMEVAAVFTPDGNGLATLSQFGPVRFWDLGLDMPSTRIKGFTKDPWRFFFSEDGRAIHVVDKAFNVSRFDFDKAALEDRYSLQAEVVGQSVLSTSGLPIRGSAVVSSDGRLLVFAGRKREGVVWNLEEKRVLARFGVTGDAKPRLAISRDKTMVAVGGENALHLWKIPSGEELPSVGGLPDKYSVYGLAFSPDDKTLAIARQARVDFLDISTNRIRNTYTGLITSPDMAFSPDGRNLVVSANAMKIIDARTLELVTALDLDYGTLLPLLFSPDGKLIASGVYNHTVRVWDVESGNQIAVLDGFVMGGGIAFSRDSSILATASIAKEIRLWNMKTLRVDAKRLAENISAESGAMVFRHDDGDIVIMGAFPWHKPRFEPSPRPSRE